MRGFQDVPGAGGNCWVGFPGGAGGIRTRGGLLTLTRFPGVRLKPLIHRSEPTIVAVAEVVFPGVGVETVQAEADVLPACTIRIAEAIRAAVSFMLLGTINVVVASAATLP